MVELRIESDEDAAAAPVRWIAAIRNAMNPTTLVALLLASILIFLVANPLFQLVKDSFTKASITALPSPTTSPRSAGRATCRR